MTQTVCRCLSSCIQHCSLTLCLCFDACSMWHGAVPLLGPRMSSSHDSRYYCHQYGHQYCWSHDDSLRHTECRSKTLSSLRTWVPVDAESSGSAAELTGAAVCLTPAKPPCSHHTAQHRVHGMHGMQQAQAPCDACMFQHKLQCTGLHRLVPAYRHNMLVPWRALHGLEAGTLLLCSTIHPALPHHHLPPGYSMHSSLTLHTLRMYRSHAGYSAHP